MSSMLREAAEGARPKGSRVLEEVDYWQVWTPMGMHGIYSV